MLRFLYHLLYFLSTSKRILKRRFTLSGLAVLVGIIVTAGIGLDTRQTMASEICTFLSAILVISVIYSFFWRFRFTAERQLPHFGTVGIPVSYRVTIYNPTHKNQKGLQLWENWANPCPTWQEFRESITKPYFTRQGIKHLVRHWFRLIDYKKRIRSNPVDVPAIPPYGKVEVRVTLDPFSRGIVNLKGITLTHTDVFGLVNSYKSLFLPQSLWILPKRYPLPPITLPSLQQYQSGGVALASSVGDAEEFIALRDYRQGDPLRKIHWKSWAKTGEPIVKEEEDEFFVRYALILDTFVPNILSEALEEAISIAASFACEVQTQESLLDLMFVENQAYCFTSGRGVGHTERMLEILASVVPSHHQSFEELTALVMTRVSSLSGCIAIFVTWDEQRQQLVDYLRQLRLPLLILVVCDPLLPLDEPRLDAMQQKITHFHRLTLGNIPEGLRQL